MLDKNYLLLSSQTALLGHISPLLRAVTINFDPINNLLSLKFFYDCKLNEQLFELASCTLSEIELGEKHSISYEVNDEFAISLPYPQEIPIEGTLVFLRSEPRALKHLPPIEFQPNTPSLTMLRLYSQHALLGKIFPSLRSAGVQLNERTKDIYFYFNHHGAISLEEKNLIQRIVKESCAKFSDHKVHLEIKRVDFPQKISDKEGRLIYLRFEEENET